MSRNKREGYFAGKYGAAYVVTRACTRGRRVGRHRPYRNRDPEYSLRGIPQLEQVKSSIGATEVSL
jgi:hypothetical protein